MYMSFSDGTGVASCLGHAPSSPTRTLPGFSLDNRREVKSLKSQLYSSFTYSI